MRSLADQTDTDLGGRWSILVRQKHDHVELDRLLDMLVGTRGEEQDAVLRRVARLVFPHAFAEESVLWPAVRRALPDGDVLTLLVEQEHQEVNELWTRLEGLPPEGDERREVVRRLSQVLRQDVRDEEDELLPRLQEVSDSARLRTLGIAWEMVRLIAPTRPHPVVSRRPPGNALAAVPLTLLDRTRDVLDAVASRSPRLHRHASRASGTLAVAAGRVERMNLLRRGEDPSTGRD